MPKKKNTEQVAVNIEDYVSLKTNDSPLAQLLQQWVELVKQIYTTTAIRRAPHAPYSYKEQANVGVLASAASKIGWAALEECAVTRDGNKSHGRVDLSLWNKKGEKYLFEAKLTVRSVKSLRGRLRVVIENAKEDARKIDDDEDSTKFATVFVIPRFDDPGDIRTIQRELDDATSLCRGESSDFVFPDSKNPDFIAYTFPGMVERKSPDHMDEGKWACGVIVMGFQVS